MKSPKFLKSNKFWKSLIIGVSVGACVIAIPSIIVPSYLKYKAYYDSVMAEREHQKYLDSLPLEYKGISAKLKDETYYYANGKAVANSSDFEVVAHFTEKGKDFETILFDNEFEVSTANDFAQIGGKVLISYTYTYELKEGETEPKKETKTTEVNVSLTDVALTKLEVIESPYKVYYKEGEKFEQDGIKAKAYYNDGTVIDVNDLSLTSDESKTLNSEVTSVPITYDDGKSKVSCDFNITVKKASEYDEGTIVSMVSDRDIETKEDTPLSTLKPVIRAKYTNGNRLIISDSLYEVKGNITNATIMSNCLLNVNLIANKKITCGVRVKVKKNFFTKDAAIIGGTSKKVDVYNLVGNIPQKEGEMTINEGLSNAKFTYISESVSKTNFSIRLSNRTLSKDNTKIEPINLSDVLSIKVNGRIHPLSRSLMLESYGEKDKYIFNEITLKDVVLNKGENSIELDFKYDTNKEIKANVALLDIAFSSMYEGAIYNNFKEVLESNNSNKESFLGINKIIDWENIPNAGPYGHALCNDGTYIYATYTTYSSSNRPLTVVKIDPESKKIVAKSKTCPTLFTEASSGITVYEDKLIIYTSDGKQKFATSLSEFKEGCEFTPYDGLHFEGLDDVQINDVYYNESKELFSVFYNLNAAAIFDKEFKLVKRLSLGNDPLGRINRMSGNEDYILFNFSKDGTFTPVVHAYDWEGNKISRTVMPINLGEMGEVVTDTSKTNTQGLTYLNGALYFSVLKFSNANGGDATAYFKTSFKGVVPKRDINLTTGEYIEASKDYHNVAPMMNVVPAIGSDGMNKDVPGWTMGGISDGKYIYTSMNINGNNQTEIHKLDPLSGKIIAKSKAINTKLESDGGDNSRLFIKDEKLYCIIANNEIVSTELDKFVEGSSFVEDKLPFDEVIKTLGEETSLKGAYFNASNRRFVLMDTKGKIYFLNEDGSIYKEVITESIPDFKFGSISGDDKHIYLSYSQNGQKEVPLDVYTWDGAFVKRTAIKGLNLSYSYNVQSIFVHNDVTYLTLCSWESGFQNLILYKVKNDMTIFEKEYLSGIEIASMPTKVNYIVGEGFDRSGLKVNALYNDGEIVKEVKDYTVSPSVFLAPGKQEVTITYSEGGLSCEAKIEVNVNESILLGDYLTSTEKPEFKVNPTKGQFGRLFDGGYSMGGASDGKYLYLAQNMSGNGSTRVLKVDPASDYKVLATSKTFETGITGTKDNSRMFIKGDKLYCFVNDGDIRSIKLSEIKDGFNLTKDESLPFSKVIESNTIIDAEYNNATKRYAALNSKGLHLVNEDGSIFKTIDTSKDTNLGLNQHVSSITSDEKYIYVSHLVNDQKEVLIKAYTWDGEFIKSCAPSGIALEKPGYNTQAIFLHNGVFYAALCTWSNTAGYYLWSISFGN